jgi:hypothetical protein
VQQFQIVDIWRGPPRMLGIGPIEVFFHLKRDFGGRRAEAGGRIVVFDQRGGELSGVIFPKQHRETIGRHKWLRTRRTYSLASKNANPSVRDLRIAHG